MSAERIFAIFREEANERLDRMVDVLLAVESDQDTSDALEALFREAHSLKGNAGLVGVDEVREMAHALEDVLATLRRRGERLPSALPQRLLPCIDAMRRATNGETAVAAEVVSELKSAVEAQEAAPPARRASGPNGAGSVPGRAGEASVRVAAAKVDRLMDVVGESVLQQRRLEHLLATDSPGGDDMRVREALDRGELLVNELQESVLRLRAVPLGSIARAFPRFVRDLAANEGKDVELVMRGLETPLDRGILDGISDTLVHLLRNALAHGIEQPDERLAAGKLARGRIELRAEHRGGRVVIEVADDGRGVSRELLAQAAERGSLADILTEAGFSTAGEVTDVAGRGVGLDAVRRHVESLGGAVAVRSQTGRGTVVELTLPLTLAVVHVLLVERTGHVFGIPTANVVEVVAVQDTLSLGGRQSLDLRGSAVPMIDLVAALGDPPSEMGAGTPAVVMTHSGREVAATCDRVLGEENVVVKSLGPVLGRLPGYLGAAVLGDGRVALMVDPSIIRGRGAVIQTPTAVQEEGVAPSKLLVVDDQVTVRELQRTILEAAGYRVTTARDGNDALDRLTADPDIELVVTDIQMPGLDGLGLLRQVRGRPELASLPVVVVTSQGSEEDRERGLEAGADAYVAKDRFDQRTLIETIEQLIGR